MERFSLNKAIVIVVKAKKKVQCTRRSTPNAPMSDRTMSLIFAGVIVIVVAIACPEELGDIIKVLLNWIPMAA